MGHQFWMMTHLFYVVSNKFAWQCMIFFCFFYCFLNAADIGDLQEKSILKPVVT
jgi:hypothetical protein